MSDAKEVHQRIIKELNRHAPEAVSAVFPTDRACLDFLFECRYPAGATCPVCSRRNHYSPVNGRKCYSCNCGHQISPTAGTIFAKSDTSLPKWFFAIRLMTRKENGIPAMLLQKKIGVGYKTAWRMCHVIRGVLGLASWINGTTEEVVLRPIPHERATELPLLAKRFGFMSLDKTAFGEGKREEYELVPSESLTPLEILMQKEEEPEYESRCYERKKFTAWHSANAPLQRFPEIAI